VTGRLTTRGIEMSLGTRAQLVEAPRGTEPRAVIASLDVPPARPLIVVNGTTTSLSADLSRRLALVLQMGVAAFAIQKGCILLSGGTDAGIFSLLGQGLARHEGPLVCIGVVPSDLVTWPGREHIPGESWNTDRVPLEPNHSHFVVVQAQEWGEETPMMLELARELSAESPSVAVLAGGGEGTEEEVLGHIRQGRTIVVLRGSGRLADEIAAAARGSEKGSVSLRSELVQGDLRLVDIDEDPEVLFDMLRRELSSKG
jgi:hypothetical protein